MTSDTAEREAFEKWWTVFTSGDAEGTARDRGFAYAGFRAAMLSASPPPPAEGEGAREPEGPRVKAHVGRSVANGCWYVRVHPFASEGRANAAAAALLSTLDPPAQAEEPTASPAPGPAEPVVRALEGEPDFVAGIQGFASMCESAARSGGMEPDDCNMVAAKLRDTAFVLDQLQKLRDGKIACGWELRPALQPPMSWSPTHRHIKRGSTYRLIGEAEAQVSTGGLVLDSIERDKIGKLQRELYDGQRLTVYQGEDGKLWARFSDEFNDGRFEALTQRAPASSDVVYVPPKTREEAIQYMRDDGDADPEGTAEMNYPHLFAEPRLAPAGRAAIEEEGR